MNMKFVKGIVMGTIISAGVMMMYNDSMEKSKHKMIKKGKQFAKKMGIL